MAELTLEQQQAIAIAQAKKAKAEAEGNLQSQTDEMIYTRDERGVPTGEYFRSDLDPENQKAIQEQHKQATRTQSSGMGITERPSLPELAAGGIYSGVKNIATSGLAASDDLQNLGRRTVSNITGGEFTPLEGAKAFDKMVPSYHTRGDSMMEDMVVTGFEAVPGLYLGGKAVSELAPAAKTMIGQFGRYLAVGAGAEVGGAISMDPDTEKWLFGPEGITGLGYDEKGTFNESLWEKKLNLIGDGLAIGGVVGTAGAGLGQGWKFLFGTNGVINNISKIKNAPKRERAVVRDFLDIIADVNPDDTAEVIAKKRADIIDFVDKHKDVLIKFTDTDNKVVDASYVDDTIGILINRLDPKTDGPMIARLESLRSSAMTGGAPELRASRNRPNIALEEVSEQTLDNRGGSTHIPQARDEIVDQAYISVDAAQDAVSNRQFDINLLQNEIDEAISMDPIFGDMINRLDGKVKIGLAADLKESKGQELVEKLFRARDLMSKEKNRLYDLIPDHATVDSDSLGKVIADSEELIPANILNQIEEAGGNFKRLNEIASTSIQKEIDLARRLETPEGLQRADALRALKDNIQDTQLDFLSQSGDQAVVDAANNAKKYFREEFAPFFRDNPTLEKIDDLARYERSPIKLEEGGIKSVDTMLNDPLRRPSVRNTEELLAKDEAGRSANILSEYQTISKISPKVEQILNKEGKITPSDIVDLARDFGEYVTTTTKSGERDRIEEFLTTIRGKDFDLTRLKEELKGLENNLKSAHETFDKNVGDFFTGKGPDRELKPEAYRTFKDVFTGDQSHKKIDDYLKAVGNSPDAKKGLEAAYLKLLKEDFLFESGKDSGVRRVNLDKLDQFLTEDSPISEYAKKILPEDTYEGIKTAITEAYNRGAGRDIKLGTSLDPNQVGEAGRVGINSMITWIFGVLNPTAARLRTVTGQFGKQHDPKDAVSAVIDTILSDPDEFVRIAKEVAKQDSRILTDHQKRILFKAMVKSGIYQSKDEEKFMMQEAQDDSSKSDTVDRQTEQNLR